MPRLLPAGGSLGTPNILGTGATFHLGPLRSHVENLECRAQKWSARCQKCAVPCRFFSACKWGFSEWIQCLFGGALYKSQGIKVMHGRIPGDFLKPSLIFRIESNSRNYSFDASMVIENTLTSILCSKNCLTNSCIVRMRRNRENREKRIKKNKSTQFSKCHFVGLSMLWHQFSSPTS